MDTWHGWPMSGWRHQCSFIKTLVGEGGSYRPAHVQCSTNQFLPPSLGPEKFALPRVAVHSVRGGGRGGRAVLCKLMFVNAWNHRREEAFLTQLQNKPFDPTKSYLRVYFVCSATKKLQKDRANSLNEEMNAIQPDVVHMLWLKDLLFLLVENMPLFNFRRCDLGWCVKLTPKGEGCIQNRCDGNTHTQSLADVAEY